MTNKKHTVVEGEIIETGNVTDSGGFQRFTKRTGDSALAWVWLLSIFALFISFIPVIGLVTAFVALGACLVKKVPPVLPIIAIIISSVITSVFLLFWLVLKAIF